MRPIAPLVCGVALVVAACGVPSSASQDSGPTGTARTSIVVAQGAGWAGHQLFGPMPGAGSCHVRHENGQVLPDDH